MRFSTYAFQNSILRRGRMSVNKTVRKKKAILQVIPNKYYPSKSLMETTNHFATMMTLCTRIPPIKNTSQVQYFLQWSSLQIRFVSKLRTFLQKVNNLHACLTFFHKQVLRFIITSARLLSRCLPNKIGTLQLNEKLFILYKAGHQFSLPLVAY